MPLWDAYGELYKLLPNAKEPDISKKLTKGYAPAPDVPTHDTTDFILIIKKEVKKTCDRINILFGVMLMF